MSVITDLSLDNLVCRPYLSEQFCTLNRGISMLPGDDPVYIGQARNVLYIPELNLQVLNSTLVPQEAIASPSTLQFEIDRGFSGRSKNYHKQFEADTSTDHVCILSNFYSRNFFHWLTEEVFKVVLLESTGFDGLYVLHGLPSFAKAFMNTIGVQDERLIFHVERPTFYQTVSYTTSIHTSNISKHKGVFYAVREKILSSVGSEKNFSNRRIWIERKAGVNNQGRDLVNINEVHELLQRYGVDRVDMAALSVFDQISLATNSDLLAGIHGAGFAHSLLMKPRSSVIECYSPLFINTGILDICRILRHKYQMLVYQHAYARYPYKKKVAVNCSHLELALMSLED